jgi:hypothetical protein
MTTAVPYSVSASVFNFPITVFTSTYQLATEQRGDIARAYFGGYQGSANCPAALPCGDERDAHYADKLGAFLDEAGAETYLYADDKYSMVRVPASSLVSCTGDWDPLNTLPRVIDACGVCGGDNRSCNTCVQPASYWEDLQSGAHPLQYAFSYNLQAHTTCDLTWRAIIRYPDTALGNDGWVALARQYIAATLNEVSGAASSAAVERDMNEAYRILNSYCQRNALKRKPVVRQRAIALTTLLRHYNTGLRGVAACS